MNKKKFNKQLKAVKKKPLIEQFVWLRETSLKYKEVTMYPGYIKFVKKYSYIILDSNNPIMNELYKRVPGDN